MERENNPAKNREGKPDGPNVANRIYRMLAVEPPAQEQRYESRDDEKNDADGIVDVHTVPFVVFLPRQKIVHARAVNSE